MRRLLAFGLLSASLVLAGCGNKGDAAPEDASVPPKPTTATPSNDTSKDAAAPNGMPGGGPKGK